MSNQQKHSTPLGGVILLTISILCVLVIILAFIDIEPLQMIKQEIRQQAQAIPPRVQQLFFSQHEEAIAPFPSAATPPDNTEAQTQTINNWQYTLNKIEWSGSTLTVDISIRNTDTQTVPFGFSYQVSDESFTTVYKLYAQDSGKQIFRDISNDTTGKGFYNRYFSPGEMMTGQLKFKVNEYSEKLYLCLAVGGNAANKLFYLGNPR